MSTTPSNTYRIAAAFQQGKDPQQDAIIAWLGGLPKDERGGVKRSVLKYHLTRALLMYIQSGSDTVSTVLPFTNTAAPVRNDPSAFLKSTALVEPTAILPTPVVPKPAVVPPPVVESSAAIPVLNDQIKRINPLRKKIAASMNSGG